MTLATKRSRRGSPSTNGPTTREGLKRFPFTKTPAPSRWSWVANEVTRPEDITREHQLTAYGLTPKSGHVACANKYLPGEKTKATRSGKSEELDEDAEIIVVSDDESTPTCSRKDCKSNPLCLNYLGQDIWENPGEALESPVRCMFLQVFSEAQEQVQEAD